MYFNNACQILILILILIVRRQRYLIISAAASKRSLEKVHQPQNSQLFGSDILALVELYAFFLLLQSLPNAVHNYPHHFSSWHQCSVSLGGAQHWIVIVTDCPHQPCLTISIFHVDIGAAIQGSFHPFQVPFHSCTIQQKTPHFSPELHCHLIHLHCHHRCVATLVVVIILGNSSTLASLVSQYQS